MSSVKAWRCLYLGCGTAPIHHLTDLTDFAEPFSDRRASALELMMQYLGVKRIPRQLVVVPFVRISTLLLGVLTALVFVTETFISEAHEGPYKFYLVCIHRVLIFGGFGETN